MEFCYFHVFSVLLSHQIGYSVCVVYMPMLSVKINHIHIFFLSNKSQKFTWFRLSHLVWWLPQNNGLDPLLFPHEFLVFSFPECLVLLENKIWGIWPCAIRSCHNRDMPKISSKYTLVHLQWHNLKSVHPTIVKVYIFRKLFLQGIPKWLYFCGRSKSKNIIADQKLKFCLKRNGRFSSCYTPHKI